MKNFQVSWTLILLCALFPSQTWAQEFHGYPCTQGCSGHEAGYEWAEDNDITDPDDCGGNSNSFIEGCQAWAEENGDSEAEDLDDEDAEDDDQ